MEYLVFAPFALLAAYIIWRLATYGAARSYFQAKLWFTKSIIKHKEDQNEGK